MNYSELVSSIYNKINRKDFDINKNIQEANDYLSIQLIDYRMEKKTTCTLVEKSFDIPDDLLKIIAILDSDTKKEILIYKTYLEGLKEANGDVFFYINENKIESDNYEKATAILIYKAKLPLITESNSTNWLLKLNPELYENAILYYAYKFFEDAASETKYKNQLDDGVFVFNRINDYQAIKEPSKANTI